MSRIIDADHLVRLPILSVVDAVALGTALETRAKAEQPLPPSIQEAREELLGTHGKLKLVLGTNRESNGRPLSAVDRSLDSAWVAPHDVCAGWVRFPGTSAKKDAAARIQEAVFKGGVAFTQLNCREQWVESQWRLDLIAEQGLEQDFITLGAHEMLTTIHEFHQEYGDVQGLTAVQDEQVPGAAESLQEFRAALRYYALQVAAHARPSKPVSQDLSRTLLIPLTTWRSRRRASAGDEAPVEPVDIDDADQPSQPAGEPASDAIVD